MHTYIHTYAHTTYIYEATSNKSKVRSALSIYLSIKYMQILATSPVQCYLFVAWQAEKHQPIYIIYAIYTMLLFTIIRARAPTTNFGVNIPLVLVLYSQICSREFFFVKFDLIVENSNKPGTSVENLSTIF